MALIDLIKQLRDRTGAGLMDCKKALLESNEDLDRYQDVSKFEEWMNKYVYFTK